jgi:hypothetical protein
VEELPLIRLGSKSRGVNREGGCEETAILVELNLREMREINQ